MQRRVFTPYTDEPIAGNYFPAPKRAILREQSSSNDGNVEIVLLTERAHGVGCFAKGSFELMMHRRCIKDDGFGVDEVLNENVRSNSLDFS